MDFSSFSFQRRQTIRRPRKKSTAPLFMNIGMHCLGCPASRGETVEQACMVHGVDPDELCAELNDYFAHL